MLTMDVKSSIIKLIVDYMSIICGGDYLNSNCCKEDDSRYNSSESKVVKALKKMKQAAEQRLYVGKVDITSRGQSVKKQLRCAISSCFDKNNICCKECDIKNCRYKCNFIDKEVCEHQYLE